MRCPFWTLFSLNVGPKISFCRLIELISGRVAILRASSTKVLGELGRIANNLLDLGEVIVFFDK